MPAEKKQGEYFYNQKWLHFLLLISSVPFIGRTLLAIQQDYDREWRKYQTQFRRMEIEKTHADMEAEKKRQERQMVALEKSKAEMTAQMQARSGELQKL